MSFDRLLRGTIRGMREYVAGKTIEESARAYDLDPSAILKLGSNENQLGASPRAVEAVREAASNIHIYPEADAHDLRLALSGYIGCDVSNIAAGAGMDGVLDTIMRLFVSESSEVLIPIPTFSYYEIASLAAGGKPVFVERDDDFKVNIDKLLDSVSGRTHMIFLCSPNNPSGNLMSEEDVRRVLESVECMVFLDEAYVEFASRSLTGLVHEYDNLIAGRTLSKAFGLAGLRIGYAVVPGWVSAPYMKAMTPFAISRAACAAGLAALGDREHLELSIRTVLDGRELMMTGLGKLGLHSYESQANFILADVAPRSAKDVCDKLLCRGIIVRDCSSFRGAGNSLVRITVGTREQNTRVLGALGEILG